MDGTTEAGFLVAASEGNFDVVKLEVEDHKLNINCVDKEGNTPLLLAAQNGFTSVVDYLVEQGADKNQSNIKGMTPLCAAASFDQLDTAACLIKHGAEVNKADSNGFAPLHWAVKKGDLAMSECLVQQGKADVNHAEKYRDSPLHVVANTAMADYLLQQGADINKRGRNGSPLYNAVANGDQSIVDLLVTRGADVKGSSCLTLAIKNGYTSIAQFLILHGADVMDGYYHRIDQKGTPNQENWGMVGTAALYIAAENGHAEIVDCLLQHGADVNIGFEGGYYGGGACASPLYAAVSNGHRKVVECLVRHKAKLGRGRVVAEERERNGWDTTHYSPLSVAKSTDIKLILTRSIGGESKLWFAALSGDMTEIMELSKEGEDVNLANANGWSPFNLATEMGNTSLVEWFLQHGACVNQQSFVGTAEVGTVPLYFAAANGHAEIVERLLQHGAEANVGGNNPMQIAMKNHHWNCVNHLVRYGVDVNAMYDEQTPLITAANEGMVESIVTLLRHSADPTVRNISGKTCFDLLTARAMLEVLQEDYSLDQLQAFNNFLWFSMIQEVGDSDPEMYAVLTAKVERLILAQPSLATVKDTNGRVAMDVASKPMKAVMHSLLLWHGRFRLTQSRPEHMSATCSVFKAVDESTIDHETGEPLKVALKLMRMKAQYQRELSAREKRFSHEFVIDVLQTYPLLGSPTLEGMADEVMDVEVDTATGQLTKSIAEKLFLLVMPLADRNLFVALKQERWAGQNMEEVRHVFVQLVHCVEHMHDKGVLHADIKTLNIVRVGAQWKLIDFDAACEIGTEPVGHKSSSAYVPPEAIYVDEAAGTACVRSAVAMARGGVSYTPLIAHPSFDVWSLGCILYQMVTTDVRPLFQGGQDDNLTADTTEEDHLFSLAEWSTERKQKKLAKVTDRNVRNLLAQMLHKDPLQRPSLPRLLAHPCLSLKQVARMVGEQAKYDVFLSYRVASDAHHVEKLYHLLTSQGLKVYWDKVCLAPGVDWEVGFCEGVVNSRAFVPLLSRDAINHPDKAWQNFSKLTTDQPNCDNVFLEHRLAVELQGLGLIEKMFPVFIGDVDATTSEYSHYFGSRCHPSLPDIAIKSVEEKLRHHMESQALGTPLVPDRTVVSVVNAITACQGAFIQGDADAAFQAAANSIVKMLETVSSSMPVQLSPRGGGISHLKALLDAKEQEIAQQASAIQALMTDNVAKDTEIKMLHVQLASLSP